MVQIHVCRLVETWIRGFNKNWIEVWIEYRNWLYQQGASSPHFQGLSTGEFSIQEDLGLSQILIY